MGLVCLELHYKVDPLLELDNLKDVMDGSSRNVDFLNHKSMRTFAMFSTTNYLSEDLDVYSLIDWKSVISSLLSMKVAFKAIVYICNQIFFNNLVVTFQKEDFMDDIFMEYEFYKASKQVVLLLRSSCFWMNLPFLVYIYLFSFTRRKVCASWYFGVKASSSMGPLLWLSISGRAKVV